MINLVMLNRMVDNWIAELPNVHIENLEQQFLQLLTTNTINQDSVIKEAVRLQIEMETRNITSFSLENILQNTNSFDKNIAIRYAEIYRHENLNKILD